jgi:valyl-tRNA synthetase
VQVDGEAAGARREDQRRTLEQEIERAEGKLANTGFVDKAPPGLVQAEREKLERFRRELSELGHH